MKFTDLEIWLTEDSLHHRCLGTVSRYTSLFGRWFRHWLHRRARVGNLARAVWLLFTCKPDRLLLGSSLLSGTSFADTRIHSSF